MNPSLLNKDSLHAKASLFYFISFSFLCALVFWIVGIHESWLVLFIWVPPLAVLRYLVSRHGFLACCFNSFAILNLAYVYMLFDYVSSTLGTILLLSLQFPPVSPSFFLSLFLGSFFCSFGPLFIKQNIVSKVSKAASFHRVKNSNSKNRFIRVILIFYVLLSVIILRALPGVIQLPLIQVFSFGFLIYLLPCLPRKLNLSYQAAFFIDYISMFALANPNVLSFGNRTSALQPLFIIGFIYAMSLSSFGSSLIPARSTNPILDQFIRQARSGKSQERTKKNIVIPKWALFACIAVIVAVILLVTSTVTKFSTQDLSLSDAINYYFEAERGYSGLELRTRIANLVDANRNIIDLQFFQLLQLITSFIPSAWFAWKPEYDITPLLFQSSIYPQPLYFEPFLNQFADMGVPGPLFYAFFIFVLHSLYVKTINVNSSASVFCWTAAQPLVIFSIIFFMQTPWHFARGSLFVMVLIAMISFVSRIVVLSPRNS